MILKLLDFTFIHLLLSFCITTDIFTNILTGTVTVIIAQVASLDTIDQQQFNNITKKMQ